MRNTLPIQWHASWAAVVVLLLLIAGCSSPKSLARTRIDFLLSQRVDTIKLEARQFSVVNPGVNLCLDTLIAATQKLPDFDTRLRPVFVIRLRREAQKTVVDFKASNLYESLDVELLLGKEDAKLFGARNKVYEVVDYRGYKFIMDIRAFSTADSIELYSVKEALFQRTGKSTSLETYGFYSQELKRYVEYPLWYNEFSYLISDGVFKFVRQKYHPSNEPLLR